MKTYLFVFVLLLTSSLASAQSFFSQELKWYTWDEGYKMAQQQKKPMMIFVYSPNCNQSKRMLEKTYTNKEVISKIQADFIPVKFDIDKATTEIEGARTMNIKQFTGANDLKKIIGGPKLSIPKSVLWSSTTDKLSTLEGVNDAEEMLLFFKEFIR